jgi:glycosyltransferase involved in cell wall biosynthesis
LSTANSDALRPKRHRPSVSVIIPCYNVESYVWDAISSVWAQTEAPHEIICVNDGSTDRTLQVLHAAAAKDPRLQVLDGPNRGAAAARNRGIRAATGEYLQLLDADDVLQAGKLEHQTRMVVESGHAPDLILAALEVELIEGREGLPGVRQVDPDPWKGLLRGITAVDGCGSTSSNLWRRESVLAVEGFDESLETSEDVKLVFELLRRGGRVVVDQVPMTVCRARPGSLFDGYTPEKLDRWIRLRLSVRAHLDQTGQLSADRSRLVNGLLVKRLAILHRLDQAISGSLCHRAFQRPPLEAARGAFGWLYAGVWAIAGFRWAEHFRWRGERIRAWRRRFAAPRPRG